MTSYATDPLLRERDRGSLLAHFDLWSYSEVVENKDAILARVAAGTMPATVPGHRRESTSSGGGSLKAHLHERRALRDQPPLVT